MEADDYVKDRVEDQVSWYDKKSKSAQKFFKTLRLAEVAFAAVIPLIAGFSTFGTCSSFVVSILGTCIALCAALIGLGNYQENWIEYRTTCESLRHEKYLFLTRTEPYNVDEAFGLFVQRVEGLVSKENSVWSQHIRAQRKNGPARDANSRETN